MTACALRRAQRVDAAAIGSLHVASWRETYAGLLPDAMLAALSVPEREAMWRGVLAAGDAVVMVAEQAGRIVGFGSCGPQRDEVLAASGFDGEIGAIYVLRADQHRGIGRAIMAALAMALADRGHAAASLWVLRDNRPACGFYAMLGGIVVGERAGTRDGLALTELAYGWCDLAALAGREAPPLNPLRQS